MATTPFIQIKAAFKTNDDSTVVMAPTSGLIPFSNPITLNQKTTVLAYSTVKPNCDKYLDRLQLFDTAHDFQERKINLGVNEIIKNSSNYNCANMIMSHLQYYSFYTNSSSSSNAILQPITDTPANFIFRIGDKNTLHSYVNDIENFVLYSAIEKAIESKSSTQINNMFQSYKKDSDKKKLKELKKAICRFFNDYEDLVSGNRINIIVDTPGYFHDILKSDTSTSTDKFSYVLTQESVYDPASSKTNTFSPIIINESYRGNAFVEKFKYKNTAGTLIGETSVDRTYTFNPTNRDDAESFESNFSITFKGLKYENTPKETFITKVNFNRNKIDAIGGSFNKELDIKFNNIASEINIHYIQGEVQSLLTGMAEIKLKDTQLTNIQSIGSSINSKRSKVNDFYTNFMTNLVSKYKYKPDTSIQNLDFYFTKKRAGDALQAKICKIINTTSPNIDFYKMSLTGSIQAGCGVSQKYKLRRLVLVTIDRMLFAYAIRNNIPAILTKLENPIILFKPEVGPTSTMMSGPITGGSSSEKYIPKSLSLSKKYNKIELQSENNNYQVGGSQQELLDFIIKIPYVFFRLIPKMLYGIIGNRSTRSERRNPNIIKTYINKIIQIQDKDLITQYDTDLCILTKLDIVYDGECDCNTETPNPYIHDIQQPRNPIKYITYFSTNEYTKNNGDNSYTIHFDTQDIIIESSEMIGYLLADFANLVTRSDIVRIIETLTSNISDNTALLSFFEDVSPTAGGGTLIKKGGSGDIKSLDMYIDLVFNNEDFLNKENLEVTNFATILSYINIFLNNEFNLCYNVESYREQFNVKNNLAVTNYIGLYVMFDFLLTEFLEQKSNISYNLLEYLIDSGDDSESKNYFVISCNLIELINCVYCNDTRLNKSLNSKIKEQIENGHINNTDSIFTSSKSYFTDLFSRIETKKNEINDYLNETNSNEDIKNYIINNLSMYGFMNMLNKFKNTLLPVMDNISSPPSSSNVARGEEPSGKLKLRYRSYPPKQQTNATNMMVYSYNRGGKRYKTRKNYNKNRKTRKNRQVNRKGKYIRKTKKNNNNNNTRKY